MAAATPFAFAPAFGARLVHAGGRVRDILRRRRKPLLAFGVAAVAAGCAWSLASLDVRWSDVQLLPLLAVAAIVVPLSIAYSALNMMLMGRAAKVPMSFGQGFRVSVFAQVAELLPLPGGALVRGAALVRAGSPARRSAELVIAFSLLWVAWGAAGAGIALSLLGWPALVVAFGGGAAAFAVAAWLAIRFGVGLAVAATALRLAGVALVAWRFVLVFAILGIVLPWPAAACFAFATILGSAASLIPAGLGVSEALSALIAGPAGVDPAAAFLAAALSRLIGLAINMTIALAYAGAGARALPETSRA